MKYNSIFWVLVGLVHIWVALQWSLSPGFIPPVQGEEAGGNPIIYNFSNYFDLFVERCRRNITYLFGKNISLYRVVGTCGLNKAVNQYIQVYKFRIMSLGNWKIIIEVQGMFLPQLFHGIWPALPSGHVSPTHTRLMLDYTVVPWNLPFNPPHCM